MPLALLILNALITVAIVATVTTYPVGEVAVVAAAGFIAPPICGILFVLGTLVPYSRYERIEEGQNPIDRIHNRRVDLGNARILRINTLCALIITMILLAIAIITMIYVANLHGHAMPYYGHAIVALLSVSWINIGYISSFSPSILGALE